MRHLIVSATVKILTRTNSSSCYELGVLDHVMFAKGAIIYERQT